MPCGPFLSAQHLGTTEQFSVLRFQRDGICCRVVTCHTSNVRILSKVTLWSSSHHAPKFIKKKRNDILFSSLLLARPFSFAFPFTYVCFAFAASMSMKITCADLSSFLRELSQSVTKRSLAIVVFAFVKDHLNLPSEDHLVFDAKSGHK